MAAWLRRIRVWVMWGCAALGVGHLPLALWRAEDIGVVIICLFRTLVLLALACLLASLPDR